MAIDATEPDPIEWVREQWSAAGQPDVDRFVAVSSILRLHQAVVFPVERALKPFDLILSSYLLLVTLHLSPPRGRRLSYLSRYLMVHPTTVTLIIDQLEAKGIVRREAHPTDRRATLAVLTPTGRALVEKANKALAKVGFGLKGVTVQKSRQLVSTLANIRTIVEGQES